MFLLGLCCLSVAWGLREALCGSCKAAALRVPTKGRLCLTPNSLLWSLRGAASGFCYQKVIERDHRRSQRKTRLHIFRIYSKQCEYLSGRVTISFRRAVEATCIVHLWAGWQRAMESQYLPMQSSLAIVMCVKLTLALSLPPPSVAIHCSLPYDWPCSPQESYSSWLRWNFPCKSCQGGTPAPGPGQHPAEHLGMAIHCIVVGMTVVWERLSCETFSCLTKVSFSIESEKVLIFFIKKSSFTFRQ